MVIRGEIYMNKHKKGKASVRSNKAAKVKFHFKMKYLISIIITISVAIALIILLGESKNNTPSGDVATVNGEPITAREFSFKLNRNKGKVIQYFMDKYSVEDTEGAFWKTEFGGETPEEYARKLTLEECIRIKVQMLLGKERGLIDDISYSSILEKLEEENKAKKLAKDNGQTVYGLQSYGEEDYFYRIFTEMTGKLSEKLKEEGLASVSSSEIQNYYEKNKDVYFKKMGYYKLQRIYIEKDLNNESLNQQLKEKIGSLHNRIINGESFEKISSEINSSSDSAFKYQERIVDENTEAIEIEDIRNTLAEFDASGLSQITDVVDEFYSYSIAKCIEKKDNGYKDSSSDDVKAFINIKLSEAKYEKYIDEQTAAADVVVNEITYSRMVIAGD